MCDSSRDILNLTLAASVAILTFLVGWLLAYAIVAVKSFADIIRRIREVLSLAEQTLSGLKERVREIGSVLPLLITTVEKLVKYVSDKKGKRETAQKSKAKDQNVD